MALKGLPSKMWLSVAVRSIELRGNERHAESL